MNKKLLVVAVAGALAAPLAAQADVTIYGKMHISLDWAMNTITPEIVSDDDDGVFEDETDDGMSVSSNFSRIGFKGSEELGGGLRGIWQVEQEVDIDDGTGDWASRNSFLGLAGGFGTVLVGRHDTPFKDVGRKVDLFGDTIGDIRGITDQGVPGVSPGFDERLNNLIAYISPDFAGFKLFAAYSTDVQFGSFSGTGNIPDNNDNDAWSVSLSYQTGPIFAAVAYELHNQAFLDPTDGDVEEDSEDAWRVAAGATFGAFKFGGMYQYTNAFLPAFVTIPGTGVIAPVAQTENRNVYHLFGQFAFGATSVGLQWTMADESDLEDAFGNSLDDGGMLWSIGLFHNLSKRTQIYGMYSLMDNDEDATFAIGGGGGHGEAYVPGIDDDGDREDPSAFSVGVIHSF